MALRATTVLVAIMNTGGYLSGLFLVHPFMTLWVGDAFALASGGVAELVF